MNLSLYNENDPGAASWLRNLIAAGRIEPGTVAETDVRKFSEVHSIDSLRSFARAHFFAGIGGWPAALDLAGWPRDLPVWTGSCPCQPFSSAGRKKGFDDARHLWPHWFQLIRVCRPPVVLGEQVEGPAGRAWLDAVFADLEGAGYACGAAVLPAAGAGAPHARHRLYFVAVADGERREGIRLHLRERRSREGLPEADGSGEAGLLAVTVRGRLGSDERQLPSRQSHDGRGGEVGLLADAAPGGRREGHRPDRGGRGAENGPADDRGLGDAHNARSQGRQFGRNGGGQRASGPTGLAGGRDPGTLPCTEAGSGRAGSEAGRLADQPLPAGGGFWSDVEWIACRDGKSRPVEPGTFPLVAGLPGRVVQLRGYGNAICVPLAAQFIGAVMEALA